MDLRRLWRRPYLLLTLTALFWSGNFVLGRAMRAEIPPVGLAFWRWTGASLLVIGFAWPHLRRDWPVLWRHWKIVTLLAAIGVASFNTLAYTALQSTPAINAFLIQSTMPVLIVALSYLFFRDRVSGRQTLGILLSLVGSIVIIAQGDLEMLRSLAFNRGDLLIFIAVISYAGYSSLLRRRPAIHPLSFVAATFILGASMLIPLYLWEHVRVRAVTPNLPTLLSILYVAIFPSVLAYLCFNRGVELAGANRAGLFFHLTPVFGGGMAILFLGESFYWYHGLGVPLILLGILLATIQER
ncbi:MAG: DMT family transporter [Caldilineales bacterium]|nr:DMT family transporter [Caldilineales bacterium]